jgi:hypothetical protein
MERRGGHPRQRDRQGPRQVMRGWLCAVAGVAGLAFLSPSKSATTSAVR